MGIGAPFAISLTGCDALGDALKPLVGRVLSLKLQDISSGFINMGMGLNVFNPNPLGLPELGMNLGLDLAQKPIAKFGTASPFNLPAEGGTNLDLGVGVNGLNVITTLLALRNADEIPYALSGQASTRELGGLSLPLSATGAISLS